MVVVPKHSAALSAAVIAAVKAFRNPPQENHSEDGTTVTLEFSWAVRIVGEDKFEYNFRDDRKVLKRSSPLRIQGVAAGLPINILKWLAGNPATETLILQVMELNNDQQG